jgi:hypothetical protein
MARLERRLVRPGIRSSKVNLDIRYLPEKMVLKKEYSTMAEILLENVSKKFGSVSVIENVTLSVRDGEFIVFRQDHVAPHDRGT